ncbi:hypothetical protein VP01_8266g1, partial [Puccinia sorghi]
PPDTNIVTISNIPQPLVENLLELNNGIIIQTHQFSKGQKVSIKLAVLIGNVVATWKIGGFLSHSGKYFCLQHWCRLKNGATWNQKRQGHRRLKTMVFNGWNYMAYHIGIQWATTPLSTFLVL